MVLTVGVIFNESLILCQKKKRRVLMRLRMSQKRISIANKAIMALRWWQRGCVQHTGGRDGKELLAIRRLLTISSHGKAAVAALHCSTELASLLASGTGALRELVSAATAYAQQPQQKRERFPLCCWLLFFSLL